MANARHYAVAERIITTEGLTFALAACVGKERDLSKARELLKNAIADALAKEHNEAAQGDGK